MVTHVSKHNAAKMLLLASIFVFSLNPVMAQTPFEKVKSPVNELIINGDAYIQRDMTDYVKEVASKTNPDYLHDEDENLWLNYLNRPHPTRATLRTYFSQASKEFGVPAQLLMAIGYVESNWTQMGPSMDIRWGIMRLGENHYCNTLNEAADLLGVSAQVLKDDARQNIRGAAALLSKYAGKEKKSFTNLNDWLEAVKQFSGHINEYTRELAAEEYYKVLKNGVKSFSLWNETYELPAYSEINIEEKLVAIEANKAESQKLIDEQKGSKATYQEWYSGNNEVINSPNYSTRTVAIDAWINHWFGTGTWAGALSWLCDPASSASAHFCIRNDGYLVQIVGISKKAWHATVFNNRAIGIEHHATIDHPEYWESTSMLVKSAEVAKYYCNAINIPKIRKFEVYEPGIYGHTDIPEVTKNCPGPMPWDRWMGYLLNGAGPSAPVLLSVENQSNNTIKFNWTANTETDLAGYRIYYSTNDDLSSYTLLAGESVLTKTATTYTASLSGSTTGYNFKITAVNTGGMESSNGDVYASFMPTSTVGIRDVLVVDAFDRMSSYTSATHTFATTYMRALRNAGGVSVSSCANEAVSSGKVSLSNYDVVVWFAGDESTVEETFSDSEQTLLKTFMQNGGKLIATGSEIGWDLSNKGTTTDKDFFANYLKAVYVSDGGSGRTPATGIVGTTFEGVSANFGVVYPEDYPDDVTANTGATNIMTYANGANCGVAYKGTFGSGTATGGVVFVSFTLETVSYEPSIKAFFIRALDFLKDDVILPNQAPVAQFTQSLTSAGKNQSVSFDASTSTDVDGTIVSYTWNFGDGATASGVTASHAYTSVGTYTVQLTVTDDDGAINSISKTVQVTNQAPTANFTISGLPAKPSQSVSFNASASSDADGTIASYAWNFGDGATASGVTASHAYAAVGNYTAQLTVTDNDGATNSFSANVEIVSCIAPSVSDFTVDYGDAGYSQVGTWIATSYSPGYIGTNYYHDGGTAENGWNVTFKPTIQTTGLYDVYTIHSTGTNRATNVPIDIIDLNGKTTVTVNQQLNNATWVLLGTYELYEGNRNSVVIRNDDANGVVIADAIRFVFKQCTDKQPVVVCNKPSGSISLCVNPSDNQYTTNTLLTADSYEWTITPSNAGTISGTSTTATVNWDNAFTGVASISVRGIFAGTAGAYSEALNVTINSLPNASFVVTNPNINVGGSITLQNNSSAGSYVWSFEGGTPASSTSAAPSIQYNTSGIFDISLTVTDANSCTKSTTQVDVVKVQSVIGLDDFEVDMGHFATALNYSGSTVGINATTSTKARTTTTPHGGVGALAITLTDNTSVTTNWLVRMLSGSGTPANNVALSSTMKIQLWLASSTANANSTISLWIDDSDGIEETAKLNIINDGAYHLYEWDLATTAYTLVTGNGSLTASTVTIDAIALRSPNGSANWSMKIDDVKAVSLGSAIFPASVAMEEQVTLGIDAEEATLSQLKVYPTLVNDYLTIEINSVMESEFEYSIFDLNGKLIERNKLYNQRNELNLSNLKSGMYFIQIFGNQSKERFKIIKQ